MMKRLAMNVVDLGGQSGTRAGASMDNSETLIARARAGDDEAFRLIFERYTRPVLRFIYNIVGQHELAEELAQETFVRAYRSMKSLRDDAKLSTWLFGIAKNVAREACRANRHDRRRVDMEEPFVTELEHDGPAPEGTLLDKELNGVINRAISMLDEDKRVVFTLKVLHQRGYDEIAEITGFSIPKVKMDLHRARVEVRKRISPYLGVSNEV
jgi:RNA polymerase sigma-70 factor (ECF subfamily)